MIYKLHVILFTVALAGSFSGCSNAGFSGGNSATKAADGEANPEKQPADDTEKPDVESSPLPEKSPPPECDLTKDFVTLKYPDDIQKCVDSGKLYDYHEKKCFDLIEKATSYECTKAGIKAAVNKLSLGSTTLGIEAYPDAKLIGCGERREGKTVLLQWWVPPTTAKNADKCAFTGNMIIGTECYVAQDAGSTAIAGASNTAEGVSACTKAR